MADDKSKAFLKAAYAVADKSEIEEFYRHWADDYDEQMQAGLGYVSPALIVEKLAAYFQTGQVVEGIGEPAVDAVSEDGVDAIVDIGCGTGLVAEELVSNGYSVIDGIDLSEAMLKVAGNRGVYRDLVRADLTEPLPLDKDMYAAAVCAGTFTHGHVGPQALDEIVRIVKPQGWLAFTVHFDLWESAGFSDKLKSLVSSGVLEQIELLPGPYYSNGADEGWFCIYRKCFS